MESGSPSPSQNDASAAWHMHKAVGFNSTNVYVIHWSVECLKSGTSPREVSGRDLM